MKEIRMLMGMPVTVEIIDSIATQRDIDQIFDYFQHVDDVFSTYKKNSEISRLNRGELKLEDASEEMKTVFRLSEETKEATDGYFDIKNKSKGLNDPSGIVKGWAIYNAAKILKNNGFKNFRVEAGGDMEVSGLNEKGQKWRIGIRNPINTDGIMKIVSISDCGIATSGTYLRGDHIYNPHRPGEIVNEIISLTVIGPDVFEADRFATAAFAMGKKGINFLQSIGFEAYQVDKNGRATFTPGFEKYVSDK